jgi:hypothetical protein
MSSKTKHVVLTFFAIAVLALFATEAAAQTCVSSTGKIGRYIFGKCYYPASVRAEVDLTHLNDAQQNPKLLQLFATPIGSGLLFCGNRSSNQPPGVIELLVQETLTGQTVVAAANRAGSVHVSVTANLSETTLLDLEGFCPNEQNYTVLSFVPCAFNGVLRLLDIGTERELEVATDSCTLQDCNTLRWDNKAGMPEQRPYTCQ